MNTQEKLNQLLTETMYSVELCFNDVIHHVNDETKGIWQSLTDDEKINIIQKYSHGFAKGLEFGLCDPIVDSLKVLSFDLDSDLSKIRERKWLLIDETHLTTIGEFIHVNTEPDVEPLTKKEIARLWKLSPNQSVTIGGSIIKAIDLEMQLLSLTARKLVLINDSLSNDENSSDDDLLDHWTNEFRISSAPAIWIIDKFRSKFRREPLFELTMDIIVKEYQNQLS